MSFQGLAYPQLIQPDYILCYFLRNLLPANAVLLFPIRKNPDVVKKVVPLAEDLPTVRVVANEHL